MATAKKSHLWDRSDLDWYVEERRASTALFKVENFIGRVFDPACGMGNIVKSAIAAGLDAQGMDIVDRFAEAPPWWRGTNDFLLLNTYGVPNIVCNPPFFRGKGTEAFIRQAMKIAAGKIAIFASLPFLAGDKRRKGLFAEYPPTRVYIITPRVSCPPGEWIAAGNEPGNGTEDWVWLLYDLTAPRTTTTLHWLEAPR